MAPGFEEEVYVVGRRTDASITLLSERLADGTRAILVFGDLMAAEAFLVAEGLGSEWQVIENIPWETTELLRATAEAGVRYVALDPPSVLTRGDEESRLVPIKAFVDYLLDR